MSVRQSTRVAAVVPTVTLIRLWLAVSVCRLLEDTLCSTLVWRLETIKAVTSSRVREKNIREGSFSLGVSKA